MPPTIDQTSYRSPNHSPRVGAIRAIVIHSGDGTKASDLAWLTNVASRVSSHYYIDRAGHVYQLVPDERVAWHAGKASYGGLTDWNDPSIGIEMEHTAGVHHDYPELQKNALRELLQAKIAQYHIAPGFIVSHRAIAMPRGRRNDPRDWSEVDLRAFIDGLYAHTTMYRARGVAIHEGPALTYPIALGGTAFVPSGTEVEIDSVKPGGWGHLADGRGFVLMEQLSRL